MKNAIAIGILLILGAAALVMFREERPDDKKTKLAEVMKPVSLDKLDTIKVKRHEGTGDKREVEAYTLKKKGGAWRLAEPVDYEVVESSMESMTTALSELKVVDIISEKAESHADLKVDDKEGIEVLAMSGKDTLAHLILGSTRNGFTFARLPKQNTVYRLKGSFRYSFDKAARLLRNKEMIKYDFKDLKQATFESGGEKLILAKEGEEGSEVVKPVGVEIKNFDESKAKSVLRSAVTMNAIDFMDKAVPDEKTGLRPEEASKVTVEVLKDEKPLTATLLIGKEDEELKKTYAKVEGKEQLFLISTYTAGRLKSKAQDFSKSEEEVEKEKKREEEAKKTDTSKEATAQKKTDTSKVK